MKECVIISGKGGTGKTSIAAAFAALSQNAIIADCDVDAADLHLLLQPEITYKEAFSGGKKAQVMAEHCIGCKRCIDLCQFHAITFNGEKNDLVEKTCRINPLNCEGCGVCHLACPVKAIAFNQAINGHWYISDTRFGPMVHATLNPAEENSGKLVSLLRKQAAELASRTDKELIIIDGSPGIGCPVIASITNSDMAIIVAEPTQSAIHDMKRVLKLTTHFNVPAVVCINKYDLNEDLTTTIEEISSAYHADVIGKIPYDISFVKSQVEAKTIIEYSNGALSETIQTMYTNILNSLK